VTLELVAVDFCTSLINAIGEIVGKLQRKIYSDSFSASFALGKRTPRIVL
jgi:hypothetical protein